VENVHRVPAEMDLTPKSQLGVECVSVVKKVRRYKAEVRAMVGEVDALSGGYADASKPSQDTAVTEAFQELEAMELETLTFAQQCDKRVMRLLQNLESKNLSQQHVWGGELSVEIYHCISKRTDEQRYTNKIHVLRVVADVVADLVQFVHTNQKERKRRGDMIEEAHKLSKFHTQNFKFTDQQIQELRAKSVKALSKESKPTTFSSESKDKVKFGGVGGYVYTDSGEDDADLEQLNQDNVMLKQRLEEQKTDTMQLSESKLMDMSAMMNTFTQKVFEQHSTVEEILETQQTAEEYTQKGVDQLQQATDASRGQQVWILTVLYLAAFSILFLDWYGA